MHYIYFDKVWQNFDRSLIGKFVKDDPATPENEAWEGDVTPVKKPRKPRSKKV